MGGFLPAAACSYVIDIISCFGVRIPAQGDEPEQTPSLS